MAKSLDREAEAFRTRSLRETSYPILIVDALYEKVRVDGVVQSTAVMVVCGINAEGKREVVGIELMPEESKDAYLSLFNSLKVRGLDKTALIISDAHKGLVSAIAEGFRGTLWQRCKIHFHAEYHGTCLAKRKRRGCRKSQGNLACPNQGGGTGSCKRVLSGI